MASLLVLWDVDYTLVNAAGVGWHLYQLAFTQMFGGQAPRPRPMSGRTDRAISLEVLTLAGVAEPRRQVTEFQAVLAARAPELTGFVRDRGRILPGAAEALAAVANLTAADLAAADLPWPRGTPGGCVVQSLLTGNIKSLAEVKIGALGLAGYLDLGAGAYGDEHEDRSDLVPVARGNAARAYRRDFGGPSTVLIGDTPLDVRAALANGARAVGVASGDFTVAELATAGAHAVLPDLTDTGMVLAAILAQPT